MRLIKIMRMDIIFLKLLVKKIIKSQTSKVKCYSKADMSIDFDIHGTILLEDELFSLGRKLRTWR
jgi:hypothetical protein